MKLRYLTAILLLIGMVGACQATIFLGISSQNFDRTENFDDDLIISGNSIRFESNIEGDLIGASQQLVYSGDCGGNIIWAGQWVTVGGEVEYSVRAFAQKVDINAVIGRNVIAMGKTIIIGPNSKISKDATIFGEAVEFSGFVGNDLKIGCASVKLSGEIAGDVSIQTANLTVMPNTVIHGDFIYHTPEDIKIPNSVEIAGKSEWIKLDSEDQESGYKALTPMVVSVIMFIILSFVYYLFVFISLLLFNNAGVILIALFSLVICGLIIKSLTQKTATRAIIVMENKFLTALGLGILIILLVPFASLIALITFIGWPLGFLMLFVLGIFSFAGTIYAMQFIGCTIGRILNLGKKPLSHITFIIGVVVVVLLMLIPYFNWLILLVVLGVGLGSLILSLDRFKDEKLFQDKMPESNE